MKTYMLRAHYWHLPGRLRKGGVSQLGEAGLHRVLRVAIAVDIPALKDDSIHSPLQYPAARITTHMSVHPYRFADGNRIYIQPRS